ncbi:hypothetical protein EUTSA_v10029098mg [Eutrema salsugineum]|uniref:Uncharacterized protein n=1 Tax=Eutrema salsugineum TaxID=72664 RepID=V4KKA3_EUTSA|nr:hypothetical protein EUTSA_v10029098mg [Eutrema salsugineum]
MYLVFCDISLSGSIGIARVGTSSPLEKSGSKEKREAEEASLGTYNLDLQFDVFFCYLISVKAFETCLCNNSPSNQQTSESWPF